MPAATDNIVIEIGATYSRGYTWQDSAGSPIDVSAYSARMQVRSSIDASATLVDVSSAGGEITLGGAAGTIDVRIGADVTDLLDAQAGVWDLELTNTGDATDVVRLVEGSVRIKAQVTR